MPGKDSPTPKDVIDKGIAAALSRRQCSFPAIVSKEAAADGRVEVQPAIRIPTAGGQQVQPKPVTIPVEWLSWDDVVFQGVLKIGDEVRVQCQDKNWLTWLLAGGIVDDAGVGGRQSGYAIAVPVQMSVGRRAPPMAPTDKIRIGTVDGNTTIIFGVDGSVNVQSASVRMGLAASPALAVARNTDPVGIAAAYTTFVSQVTAVLNAPGPVIGAPGLITPVVSTTVGTISATSVEVAST